MTQVLCIKMLTVTAVTMSGDLDVCLVTIPSETFVTCGMFSKSMQNVDLHYGVGNSPNVQQHAMTVRGNQAAPHRGTALSHRQPIPP
jgi:hypothetical protein